MNVKDVLISLSLSFQFYSQPKETADISQFCNFIVFRKSCALVPCNQLTDFLYNRYRYASVFGVVVWLNFDSWVKFCFSLVLVHSDER